MNSTITMAPSIGTTVATAIVTVGLGVVTGPGGGAAYGENHIIMYNV